MMQIRLKTDKQEKISVRKKKGSRTEIPDDVGEDNINSRHCQ